MNGWMDRSIWKDSWIDRWVVQKELEIIYLDSY